MKLGLLVLLTLALGSVATHFLLEDNGYVLINFRGYSVEMSVPVMAFLLILLYLAARLLVRVWQAPRQLGEAASRATVRRAGRRATEGLVALSDGKLARGERLLTKAAGNSPSPVLNYLAAARAAQMQDDPERRDNWLRMAYEQDESAANAVLLTQAELQLGNGEREQALASLSRILEKQARHPEALRLLAKLHHDEQDWKALAELLPTLRKLKNINRDQLDKWTLDAAVGQLGSADIDQLRVEALWQDLPRAMRKRQELIRARMHALVRTGALTEASTEIQRTLKAHWDDSLVELYGNIEPRDPGKQLTQIERWLRDRPEDPVLLLAAGRSCVRNELWGKARSYLESSLAVRPSAAAYGELGNLMLKLGENAAATAAFRRGLNLDQGAPSDLPRLEADPQPDQG
ncbi:MAG: heme biosynthesis HemY N-terminal domain-containing protein [Gammaproteobacteria bacterium]|nr:heme biosynthesis HemY N-terminal domain-containing protein [Gammaproteobacteria bacterium]